MDDSQVDRPALVPLGEAERICGDRIGMSEARFRHELASYVRGKGGIPWVVRETEAGIFPSVLERLLGAAESPPAEEQPND